MKEKASLDKELLLSVKTSTADFVDGKDDAVSEVQSQPPELVWKDISRPVTAARSASVLGVTVSDDDFEDGDPGEDVEPLEDDQPSAEASKVPATDESYTMLRSQRKSALIASKQLKEDFVELLDSKDDEDFAVISSDENSSEDDENSPEDDEVSSEDYEIKKPTPKRPTHKRPTPKQQLMGPSPFFSLAEQRSGLASRAKKYAHLPEVSVCRTSMASRVEQLL